MFNDILTYIQAHWDDIINAVLALIGAFTIIAKLTPTTVDDNILAFILKVVNFLSLNIKPAAKVEATKEIVEAGIAKPAEAADAVTGITTEQVVKAVK